MNFDTMPPVLEHIRAGKLRALAISTPKRLDLLSQVPTFSEVGIQGFDVTNWYAIIGPKGMAPEVVAKIDRAVRGAMSEPAIKSTLDSQGLQTSGPSTPEAFGTFIKAELDKYSKMVKELNIKSE
jgi:tripartite-type tricarboxylate transporter receptor subunit TctC